MQAKVNSGDLLSRREDLHPPQILRLKDVIAMVGLGRSHIYNLMNAGDFPKSMRLSARTVGWLAGDVAAWIARRAGRELLDLPAVRATRTVPEARVRVRTAPRPLLERSALLAPSREEHQELERLRALESRVRQWTELHTEIAALLKPEPKTPRRDSTE